MSVPPFDPATAPLLDPADQPSEKPLPAERLDQDWLRARFLNPSPPDWFYEPVMRPVSIAATGTTHGVPADAPLPAGAAALRWPARDGCDRGASAVPAGTGSPHRAAAVLSEAEPPVTEGGSWQLGGGWGVAASSLPSGPGAQPGFDRDLLELPARLVPAAVLVPLIPCADGLGVLLTVRSRLLRKHRGQIAFPGGRIDAEDASPEAAALREAHEEIGLPSTTVDVLGGLPWHETGTGFQVRPVVGLLDAQVRPERLVLAQAEVEEVFVVPLAYLMNPAHHQRRLGRWWQDGQVLCRTFYAMPWRSPAGREYFIWGATAVMLRNLYHFLAAD